MDSVTHLATGIAMGFAKPWLPRNTSLKLALPLGLIVTSLPDIDAFFGTGLKALLVIHRGVTHSILGIIAMAMLLSLAAYWSSMRLRPHPGRMALFAFCLTGLAMHVMLDCLTAFGTQIFLPLSNYRFSLPIVYIVDIWWTIPLLSVGIYCVLSVLEMKTALISALGYVFVLALLVLFFTPEPLEKPNILFPMPLIIFWVLLLPLAIAMPLRLGRQPSAYKVAWAGMIWIFLYPALAFGISRHVKSMMLPKIETQIAAQQNGQPPLFGRVTVLAEPFSPLNWKILTEDANNIYMTGFSFLSPGEKPQIEKQSRPTPEFWAELAQSSPLMAAYTRFIEYPAILESRPLGFRPQEDGHTPQQTAIPEANALQAGTNATSSSLGDAAGQSTSGHAPDGSAVSALPEVPGENMAGPDRDVIVLDMRYKTTVPKVAAAFGRDTSTFGFELRLNADNKPIAYRLRDFRASDHSWRPINQ